MYEKFKHNIMTNMAKGEELAKIREKYKVTKRSDYTQVVEYDINNGNFVKIYNNRREILANSNISEINLDCLLDSLIFYRIKSFTGKRFFVLRRNLPYNIPNHINMPKKYKFTIEEILKTN